MWTIVIPMVRNMLLAFGAFHHSRGIQGPGTLLYHYTIFGLQLLKVYHQTMHASNSISLITKLSIGTIFAHKVSTAFKAF
jgi:hypothetical protein